MPVRAEVQFQSFDVVVLIHSGAAPRASLGAAGGPYRGGAEGHLALQQGADLPGVEPTPMIVNAEVQLDVLNLAGEQSVLAGRAVHAEPRGPPLRSEAGLINRDDAAAAEGELHDPVAAGVHKPVRTEDGPARIGPAE